MEKRNTFRDANGSIVERDCSDAVCYCGIIRLIFNKLLIRKWFFSTIILLFMGYLAHFSFIDLNQTRPTRPHSMITDKLSTDLSERITSTSLQQEDFLQENDNGCKETFDSNIEYNLNVIENYPVCNASKYIKRLGMDRPEPNQLRTFPVFVTAFDSSHFNESQGFFKCLHDNFSYNPRYKGEVLIVVYDIGLTTEEREKVQRNCKCELRTLDFEYYPSHVRRLSNFAFKPIIIQEVLIDFGFIWWIDTSIRFMTNNIDSQIEYAKKHSFLYVVSRNVITKTGMTRNTLNSTFDFLHEDRCKFRPFHEIWGGVILLHFDRISRTIANAWVKCALNEQCIAPTGSEYKRACDPKQDYDGRCHRFDQSVISIITRRLFHNQDYPINENLTIILKTKRDETVHYFI